MVLSPVLLEESPFLGSCHPGTENANHVIRRFRVHDDDHATLDPTDRDEPILVL
jgi:hypothetical protein